MKRAATVLFIALSLATLTARLDAADESVARGKALVGFGACNDCHTPGWRESDGTTPVRLWMTGSTIGFRTASGTSYPTKVRLDFQAESEAEWVHAVRTRGGHPPMVWQNVRGLPDSDLRAIYAFIHSLGPAGTVSPAAIPPWREPKTRFIDLRVQPAPK